jgi:hypothetical protein
MWKIAEQVQTAITTLSMIAARVPPQDAAVTRDRVFSRYASPTRGGALWERLADVVSVQDADGWKRIAEYAGDHPGILFFNSEDEPAMFEFTRRRDVVAVLAECTGFEFYLTDIEATFLLCFNHHDFMIAAGDARSWLLSCVQRRGDG